MRKTVVRSGLVIVLATLVTLLSPYFTPPAHAESTEFTAAQRPALKTFYDGPNWWDAYLAITLIHDLGWDAMILILPGRFIIATDRTSYRNPRDVVVWGAIEFDGLVPHDIGESIVIDLYP